MPERTLDQRRQAMIAYLRLKVDEQDWHGVADAAMDLREIDAVIKALLDDAVIVSERLT